MKNTLFILLILFSGITQSFAQVAVNNDGSAADNSAMLDIKSSNKGLLIPRMSFADTSNITSPALGLIIFITNDSSFYYHKNSGWVKMVAGETGWTVDGNTVFNLDRNIGIGTDDPEAKLAIHSNSKDTLLILEATQNDSATQLGEYIDLKTGKGDLVGTYQVLQSDYIDNTGSLMGLQNKLLGTGNTSVYAIFNDIYHSGSGRHYAMYNRMRGTALAGYQYGIYQDMDINGNHEQYGLYNIISGDNTSAQYGCYNYLSGNGSSSKYGVSNRISTDSASSIFGTYNRINSRSSGEIYGTYNTLLYGAGKIYGAYQYISSDSNGVHYGCYNRTAGDGNGTHYNVYNLVGGDGSGEHYGNYSYLFGAGTGKQYGNYSFIATDNNNEHYGVYNKLNSSGNGDRFGTYSLLAGNGGGSQYGNYVEMTNSGDGDHYGNYVKESSSGTGKHYGNYVLMDNPSNGRTGNYVEITGNGGGVSTGSFVEVNTTSNDNTQYGYKCMIKSDGSGWHYGSYNYLTGSGTGMQTGTANFISTNGSGGSNYGVYNFLSGNNSNSHFGVYSYLAVGSGYQYGSYQVLDVTNDSPQYGTYSYIKGGGSGVHVGSYNFLTGNGTGNQYGTFNAVSGDGDGNKYATYNFISSSAGGVHFGVYSDVDGTNNYAGYFKGNVFVRDKLGVGTYSPIEQFEIARSDDNSRMILSDGGNDQRLALLLTAPNSNHYNYSRIESYKYGTNAGGRELHLNTFGNGQIIMGSHTKPSSDNSYDLGSSSVYWRGVYYYQLHAHSMAFFPGFDITKEILEHPVKASNNVDKDGLKQIDPVSIPRSLTDGATILTDNVVSYNYQANYQQQVQISALQKQLEEQQKTIEQLKNQLSEMELLKKQINELLKK